MVSVEAAGNRERFVTVQTFIGLLPVMTPSMTFKVAFCREDFVTVQTSIVLLLGVRH